jgi:hypothetical protein
MDKVMKRYLNDQISKEGFGKEYRPLEERSKQLEEQIPQLQGEIDFLKIQYLSSDDVLHEAQDLYSRWQTLEREEKRKVVENITEKIVIGKDDVTINLCYLPSGSEIMAEKQRGLIPALPFCHVVLKGKRALPGSCPNPLKTLGDHLRKRRLDLGLLQREVAKKLGVTTSCVWNSEGNATTPIC